MIIAYRSYWCQLYQLPIDCLLEPFCIILTHRGPEPSLCNFHLTLGFCVSQPLLCLCNSALLWACCLFAVACRTMRQQLQSQTCECLGLRLWGTKEMYRLSQSLAPLPWKSGSPSKSTCLVWLAGVWYSRSFFCLSFLQHLSLPTSMAQFSTTLILQPIADLIQNGNGGTIPVWLVMGWGNAMN